MSFAEHLAHLRGPSQPRASTFFTQHLRSERTGVHTMEAALATLKVPDVSSSSDLSRLSALPTDPVSPCTPGLAACSTSNSCMSLLRCLKGNLINFFSVPGRFPLRFQRCPLLFAEEDEVVDLRVQLIEDRNERSRPAKSGRTVVRQAQTMAMVGSI